MIEAVAGGVAAFDADSDQLIDIYFTNGADSRSLRKLGPRHWNRLYRNLGDMRFADVTERAGVAGHGYSMGVAAADYDNDGDADLFVAGYRANILFRNDGTGVFSDATNEAGIANRVWSVAAGWFDFDRDGALDLFVVNYLDWDPEDDRFCGDREQGLRIYCSPTYYAGLPNTLYRNLGDGTFEDVSVASGIGNEPGSGLGAVAADFNGDRWIDLYVANDLMWNRLWINRGDGTFADNALLAGVAVNSDGQPEAGMGVDAGDFDGDGDPDIVLSHLEQETNTLYVNGGAGLFRDQSSSSQLGPPSLPFTAFGIGWIDYDNDSRLDLLVVNGAVIGIDALIREGDPYPLRQTDQLFHNLGDGTFADVTAEAGPVFESSEVSRAAAFGDVDNDGDLDVVIVNSNGPTRLLLNQVGQDQPWLGLRLVAHNRDALGAHVTIHRPGATPIWRHVHTDGSYASARDPRVLVGLGDGANAAVNHVEVRWPDGAGERWTDVRIGEYQTLVQGEGEALDRQR